MCLGEGTALMTVGTTKLLGHRATAQQVLDLLNAREGLKQQRRSSAVKIGGSQVQLHELYNAVQQCGVSATVRTLRLITMTGARHGLSLYISLSRVSVGRKLANLYVVAHANMGIRAMNTCMPALLVCIIQMRTLERPVMLLLSNMYSAQISVLT